MLTKARGAATAALLFLGAGCVPLSDYNALKERFEKQEDYVKRHKDEVKELEKREQFLTLQAREKEKDMELLRGRLAKSEHLRAQLEAGMKSQKIEVTSQPASVKPEQTTSLGGFHINPNTGGIVLDHDILFASGQHTLKDSGKHVLNELVSKLNSAEFSKYVIRVDGHTDNAPVVKTKKENHDNWELGAKRAKVVLDYMISKGVAPQRCFFASFGPYRPLMKESGATEETSEETTVVEKSTKKGDKHHKPTKKHTTKKSSKPLVVGSGSAQNRRVEIVLFEK